MPVKFKDKILIIIMGPTAVGKSSVAIEVAKRFSTQIISADSRQFYKELKIGTAAPTEDQIKAIPHHLVGHLSIRDQYNVAKFEEDALKALKKIFLKHKYAVMVGGSGLYLDAICHGIDEFPDPDIALREKIKSDYKINGIDFLRSMLLNLDPEYYEKVDRSNPNRMIRAIEVCMTSGRPFSEMRKNQNVSRDFGILKVGLNLPRQELHERINQRVDTMMKSGLLEEAKLYFQDRDLNALNTVGYKEMFTYLEGRIVLEEAINKIKTNTRRFARRQLTWFRRDDTIRWFLPSETALIFDYISSSQMKLH